jgi:hypothetical protein
VSADFYDEFSLQNIYSLVPFCYIRPFETRLQNFYNGFSLQNIYNLVPLCYFSKKNRLFAIYLHSVKIYLITHKYCETLITYKYCSAVSCSQDMIPSSFIKKTDFSQYTYTLWNISYNTQILWNSYNIQILFSSLLFSRYDPFFFYI